MNNTAIAFKKWMEDAKAMNKAAADAAAFEMKDPTDKGTPEIPSHPEGNNRSALNLPINQSNSNEGCIRDTNILSVTKPNGVGQGEYIKPENGNAKDEAFTSPTTPLSKIANRLDEALAGLTTKQAAPAPAPAPVAEPAPAQEFAMPTQLRSEPNLLEKLAGIGAIMTGTEEGRAAVAEALEKIAGAAEARNMIAEVQEEMYKEAAAAQAYAEQTNVYGYAEQPQLTQEEMQKIAAAEAGHTAILNMLETDMEKIAYAQGAADAEAMDASMQAGGEPEIPGSEDLSDEDIMGVLQELVASGQVSEEEIAELIQQLGADGEPGGSLEEIAAALKAAVESGELDPAAAEAIAQEILASDPEAQGMVAEQAGVDPSMAAAPEAGMDPAMADAAAAGATEDIAKTASVMQALFGNA